MSADRCLPSSAIGVAILAKAPVPGYAKTRLIPAIGAQEAARLQAALLRHALSTVRGAGLGATRLWCAPDAGHPGFAGLPVPMARRHAQPDGDLGQRMAAAIAAAPGRAGTLLIGTDCPALRPGHLRWAADALRAGRDGVLLPAEDGGYVLIGMRVLHPALFSDIEWGSPRVLEQTRHKLRTLGLDWLEGETLWDVDRPDDLPRLMRHFPALSATAGLVSLSAQPAGLRAIRLV